MLQVKILGEKLSRMNMVEKAYFTSITWKPETDGFSTPALFAPDVRNTRWTSRVAQGCQPTSWGTKPGHPGRCTDVTGGKARPRLKATSVICKGTGGTHFRVGATRLRLASTQFCHRSAKAAADNRYKNEHDWTIKFYLWTHELEFHIIFTYHKSFMCSNHLRL